MVDFQPSFGRLAFLKEWRHKKKLEETQLIPVLDPKKSKAKRQEMSILPDGRKIVRTIRFEREDKKRACTYMKLTLGNLRRGNANRLCLILFRQNVFHVQYHAVSGLVIRGDYALWNSS